ncbi:PorV/PorQ family protein [candidate division KSB1 bacterium]|nr:PorV/PorQ family protein [candidate division KSB1 bacterium]
MKKFICIFLICIAFVSNGLSAGKTGFAVLKIGAGARATAMGEAFTALSDDAAGVFWNPAGSIWMESRQVHITYNKWIQGVQNNIASLVFPLRKSAIGIGLVLNNVSDIERRTHATEEPLGTFSSHDFSLSLNYARFILPNFSLGFNLKYLNEKIYVESASGIALDMGCKYQLPVDNLFVAAAVQNLGSTNDLKSEQIDLPALLRAGVVYSIPLPLGDGLFHLAGDVVMIFNEESHVNMGLEILPFSVLAIRAGFLSGYEEKSLSTGFGINIGDFCLDYAYVPFERNLGNAHRFSLLADF